ncbi:MAG: methyltransferase domain-containing protein [Verrucomicrobiota bacterium]
MHAWQRVRLVSGFLFIALVSGCSTTPPPTAAPVAETSVRPDINQEYLKPDLDVKQWVERFEKEGREVYDQRNAIIRAARIQKGATVADIGAGTGLFTGLLAGAVGPQGKVYAVDIVPAFVKHLEQRFRAEGVRHVQTVLCTERSVELPPGSIDIAYLCDVYHHFEYPKSSLATIHRALRPGGELVVVEFKRIPGVSSDWILNHVRAGQEVFTAEIEAAGFVKVEEALTMKDNYMLRFRRAGK